MYIGHGRLCVCVSVCLSVCLFFADGTQTDRHRQSPHFHTTARTRMQVGGIIRGALQLCTIGWICSPCTGFVAITTQRRTRNVSECLYSLYAWFDFSYLHSHHKNCQFCNAVQLYCAKEIHPNMTSTFPQYFAGPLEGRRSTAETEREMMLQPTGLGSSKSGIDRTCCWS